MVRLLGGLEDGRVLMTQLGFPPEQVRPGEAPFYSLETLGVVGVLDGESYSFLGVIADGSVVFERAGRVAGAVVSGHFHGRFHQVACLTPAVTR